jgi:hypothetical protein
MVQKFFVQVLGRLIGRDTKDDVDLVTINLNPFHQGANEFASG